MSPHPSKPHAKPEKVESHKIIKNEKNRNIIDTEIALEGSYIDLATINKHDEGAKVTLFEVKLFKNNDLHKQNENDGIFEQMERYSRLIKENRNKLIENYCNVCRNILSLEGVAESQYSDDICVLIESIADGTLELFIKKEPELIITDFSQDQKNGKKWKSLNNRLEVWFPNRLTFKGMAENVVLR